MRMRGWTVAVSAIAVGATLHCGTDFRQGGGPVDQGGQGGDSGDSGSSSGAAGGDDSMLGGADQGGTSSTQGGAPAGGGGNTAGDGAGATGGAPPTGNPVHGKVVTPTGIPLEGWTVKIDGVSAATNEDGEFSFVDAAATYELLIAPTNDHLRLYQGLSTREPIVVMAAREGDPGWVENTASVSGTVFNATLDGGVHVEVWMKERTWWLPVAGIPGDRAFGPFNWSWWHEGSAEIELVGIHTDLVTWRFGTTTLTLTDSTTNTNGNITVNNLPTRSVTASATLGTGVSLTSFSYCLSGFCYSGGTTSPATKVLPKGVNNYSTRIEANGTHASGTTKTMMRVPDDDTMVTGKLTAPSALLSPDDAADGVDESTPFDWAPYADGVYLLEISADDFLFELYTEDSAFTLSAASKATYSAGVEHSWRVVGVGPVDGMDDLVTGNTLLQDKGVEYLATSTSRTFTP